MSNQVINLQENRNDMKLKINVITVGIALFTLAFSTINTFISSDIIKVMSLAFSIIIIIFGNIVHRKTEISVTRIELLWLLFLIIFILNIALKTAITNRTIIDMFVFSICIIFLLLSKVKVNYFYSSIKLIKYIGLLYAFSVLFQYLYTDVYLNYVLPLFTPNEQARIINLLRKNSYTGFTNQTAHIAGYIVSSIGVILFSNFRKSKLRGGTNVILLGVLFIALLLTTKRAHLLFMLISSIATFIISVRSEKVFQNLIKLLMILFSFTIIMFIVVGTIDKVEDTPLAGFANKFEKTITGIADGEDITSGRTVLYNHSLSLFKEKPITGIGWVEFRKNHSLGLIRSDIPSHPHNIYIQLLTELGLIGFMLFVFPLTYMYLKTFQMLRYLNGKGIKLYKWNAAVKFSFYNQTFFILYGLTGNLLTDHNFLIIYFFACAIGLSALTNIKHHNLSKL